MPNYTVQDTQSGKTITFEWNDKNPPTDADMEEIFASAKDFNQKTTTQPKIDPLKDIEPLPEANAQGVSEELGRPMLEMGAMGAGSSIGMASPVPGGSVMGGGIGYAIGKQMADLIYNKKKGGLKEQSIDALNDIKTGAFYEMMGQSAGKVLEYGAKVIGQVMKPFLGRISGVHTEAINEALKSASKADPSLNPLATKTQFDKALRGKITGEEIVENAKNALEAVKNQRQLTYQSHLAEISKNNPNIDTYPIIEKLTELMDSYNIQFTQSGKIDTSRIAMGAKGRRDIKEIINTVLNWGSKEGDNTAIGLDVLKRQLDDFYSKSSQARQFVTSIRNIVKDTIIDNVPQYAEMTKGYAEATNLIKDIEAGLMLRKQGMSGRIIADQTLRRLMSSMRDNFSLRKELVDVLGAKGGQELSEQIAGHTMRSVVPVGLAGAGPVLIAETMYARFFNPKFWPVLAASSPRVQAEFLRLWGQSLKMFGEVPPSALGATILQSEKLREQ